ncbi:MAG: polyprenol monophosphomannose synthase [Actinobacteria bacterium]|nr:MAG: polyprenol monophosphomannose synthase [Actinomycetota bacterium]
MTDGCDLSIVVPTYNERERLEELVGAVSAVFREYRIAGEVVIVDDNSPDGTGAIADALAERHPVQVVHRAGKLGLGSAVIDGFGVARGSMLGVMDADLSHPPSALAGLLAAIRALDVDAVVGSRYIPGGASKNWPVLRLAMSRFACVLARPLTPVRDATSGLFVVRREAIAGARISAAGFKICLELLLRSRIASVAEVPYVFADRAAGQSKMTLREALGYFIQLRDLYALKFLRGGRPRARYARLSVDDVAKLVREM